MGQFTPTNIANITDKGAAAWEALNGTSGSGFGCGDGTYGYSKKLGDLNGIIAALGDAGEETILAPIVQGWPTSEETAEIWNFRMTPFFAGLDREARQSVGLDASIKSLDTLMSWLNFRNGVTYWQCLAHMDWVAMFNAIHGVNPDHHNVYYQVTQGASYGGTTFTNALAKLVVPGPTTTLGFVIDPTTFSGGLAYWTWTGGTGSGIITVTGLDQDGNAETWTVTQTGASGSLLMTPSTHAYSLITKVLTVAAAGGVTATTGYVESHAPAGRSVPPT